MIHKCNILVIDCNGNCYGIVYFCQMLMDINVNLLKHKMDQFVRTLACMLNHYINIDWILNKIE